MRLLSVRLALILAIAGGLVPMAASPAAAACGPSGGQTIPDPSPLPGGDFVVIGGGWGHGIGMSQYGAQGAAKLGCTATEILQAYYPGVSVGQAPTLPESFRVSLFPERPGGGLAQKIRVRAHTGPVQWVLGDETLDQPTGRFWRIEAQPDGSYRIHDEAEADELVWSGTLNGTPVRVPLDGPQIIQLSSKPTNAQWPEGRPYAHGRLEFLANGGPAMYVTVHVDSADGRNALERYLRGLSEMPSSWEPAALQAQAITGRSYAQDKWESFKGNRTGCRCDVYDSTSDQVYSGHLKESEKGAVDYGARWVGAVDATAGQTMRHDGKTAVGYYSSSHGGHSESNAFVWGSAAVAYLQPVDDSRWDLASPNPLRRWAVALSKEQIGAAFGVGAATRVTLPDPKGAGGRIGDPARGYGGVRIEGTTGAVTVSGDAFRSKLGLRSTLFSVRQNVPPPTVGRCDATGSSTTGATRVSGAERVGTAVAVSAAYWPAGGAEHALLATSENFPDALASGALAAALDAPLLLTPKTQLPDSVRQELERLGAKTVWILGGEGAVSGLVADELAAAGHEVRRVRGANRFETARNVALQAVSGQATTVALGMDQDWPSAVTAGALAATPARVPTLLVHADEVPDVTERTLADLGTQEVLLIGGTATIAPEVEQQLRELGLTVRRLSGETRFHTSQVVAQEVLDQLPAGARTLVMATGRDFPDALAAAALAARLEGPLLLGPSCNLDDSPPSRAFVESNAPRLGSAALVGGRAALSDRVLEQLAAAVR